MEPSALADNKYHLTTLNYKVVNVIFELALTSHEFHRRVVNDDYSNDHYNKHYQRLLMTKNPVLCIKPSNEENAPNSPRTHTQTLCEPTE